ncbi:DUF2922 domain-containing protein [Enterococcus hulanensis]|uniref:DUF2922 domain-containing protein n=1 Tax=Enterococcus hulanensis TaxID=2559929 RepID=UPI001A8FF9B3|nr:DUF2922 domain-containing protein [Enterococcus hulanensis]MBO0457625.1 DUF2922 domain-containing protein [Enterococcus hulanensis]
MYAVKTIKTKKLVSTFKKSNGKKKNLIIKNPTVEKSAEEIREAMELLTTLDIFEEEDGVKTYAEVDTCKYIETTKYIQFDKEHPVEAVEPVAVPKPVEASISIKPKYEKFIDLVCPRALEKLPNINVESTLAPINNAAEAKPTVYPEPFTDLPDSNVPLRKVEKPTEPSPEEQDQKTSNGSKLLNKIKGLLLGSSP